MSPRTVNFRRNGRLHIHTPTSPYTYTYITYWSHRSETIHLENITGFLVGFTVLAVLHPCCVIGIPEPGIGALFKGRFTNCQFFYNEQQTLPVKFTCAAWCQCMLLCEGEDGSLWRYVEVVEDGDGTFTVTITECQEKDEDSSLTEDSTCYIFHLDDGGKPRIYIARHHKWLFLVRNCVLYSPQLEGSLGQTTIFIAL